MGALDKLNIDIDDVKDIAPVIKELLPLVALGVKGVVGLISDLVDMLDKARDGLDAQERADLIAKGKASLARLKAAQNPTP